MEFEKIIKSISQERFAPYQHRYPDNLNKGLLLYQANIEISQSFYSSLSILEVALRNAINDSFRKYYGKKLWFKDFPVELRAQIEEVESRLRKSKKEPGIDRIIAELNFGFWTILFNRKYAKYFWKPLLKGFPQLPDNLRKRTVVSAKLNHIRTFRNRVYHYEPIIWNIKEIVNKRKDIYEILNWIEPETEKWAKKIDRFEETRLRIKNYLP